MNIYKIYYYKWKQTMNRKMIIGSLDLVMIYLLVDLVGMKGWVYALLTMIPFTILQIYIDLRSGYTK